MAATETSARANAVLDELYRQHVGDVYRYTYAVLGNHADAEDVTQTTFVNALRALERGETPDDASRWLTVIAHNLVRQRWRQAANRPALVELETDVPDAPDEDEAVELEELVRALQRIPETQREAIVMRELEGRSYREIATVLGLSTAALETLLFRARRSLADELENVVTCQNAELSISKRLDGRLSRKERRRLDEHLADCPDCARLAATQQRQRRAFKGLALLPLPIGLALFKGAPSAAAATSLPTIGLGTAGAGTSGAGAAGTAGAGATAATTTGGAAVGGSLAGGLVVKVAAVVVTATVATGVGYKGVQAVRDAPTKPAPADVKPKAQDRATPPGIGATGTGHVKPAPKPHATPKRHATGNGKAVSSPGRAKHGAAPPPGLTKTTSTPARGHANGVGPRASADERSHVTGREKPKHVDQPKQSSPKRTPAPKQDKEPKTLPAAPKAGQTQAPPPSTPTGTASAPVGDSTTPSSGATTAPTTGATDPTSTTTPVGTAPTQPAASVPATSTTPATSSPTPPSSAPPPPSTSPTLPTEPPATPPTGSTGGDARPSNNGWDNGKKLGFYNENQDGKHLTGS